MPAGAPRMCIACGSAPRAGLRLPDGTPLHRCPRCGLQWWDWPPFDPAVFYDESYFRSPLAPKGYEDYAALEAGVARTARGRLRRIERLVRGTIPAAQPRRTEASGPHGRTAAPRPPQRASDAPSRDRGGTDLRLLELGCGPGVFLHEARQRGWQVRGVEVCAWAAEQARARGLDVERGAVEGRDFGTAVWDCIALWDVLEHLRDPAGVLAAAGRGLRPGGVLAISTGDVTSLCARLSGVRWHLYNLPEHLFFFSPAALRLLVRAAGCRLHRVFREPYWAPAAYLLERLRKTGGWLKVVANGAAGPLGHLGGAVLPATLWDVLGVYAVRGGDSLSAGRSPRYTAGGAAERRKA